MRIADLATNHNARAGSHGSWRSEARTVIDRNGQYGRVTIWHYSTIMLDFRADDPTDERYLWIGTGHGTASDQGGMNKLFSALKLPYYFSRKGGASIVPLSP